MFIFRLKCCQYHYYSITPPRVLRLWESCSLSHLSEITLNKVCIISSLPLSSVRDKPVTLLDDKLLSPGDANSLLLDSPDSPDPTQLASCTGPGTSHYDS